ncbi:MAG: hypothetical protein R2874_16900 [Desulfobacterales bacterium]
MPDITELFRLNMAAFTSDSYFSDARFCRSFERFAMYLRDMGMLKSPPPLWKEKLQPWTWVLFSTTPTRLWAGAPHGFVGIAKVINLHHLEWACHNRMEAVDFSVRRF